MSDSFHDYADSASAPARRVVAIAPSETDDLGEVTKAIYVGTGGDLTLVSAGAPAGSAGVAFRNLPSGALLPVRSRRVTASGTSAADLLALL